MEVFSWRFLFFFLVVVLILSLTLRKKRVRTAILRKTISIRGKKLQTPVSIDTPLSCLLDDNCSFGEDYRNKKEPDLPHTEKCQCTFLKFHRNSGDCFLKDHPIEPRKASDLGLLLPHEQRYYKYLLIANHKDASTSQREEFSELSERIEVNENFKKRVFGKIALIRDKS